MVDEMIMLIRLGRGFLGREFQVLRPIIMNELLVMSLKCLRSFGRFQGIELFLPMPLFWSIAVIISNIFLIKNKKIKSI